MSLEREAVLSEIPVWFKRHIQDTALSPQARTTPGMCVLGLELGFEETLLTTCLACRAVSGGLPVSFGGTRIFPGFLLGLESGHWQASGSERDMTNYHTGS